MRTILPLLLLLALPACKDDADDTAPPTGDTDSNVDTECAAEALETVSAMVGTFGGSWEMFGLDAQDQPVVAMTWTDVATATDPVAEAGRAYVSITDVMDTDAYGQMEQSWIEGVYIEDDCSVGVPFMEMDGEVTEMPWIEDDHVQYTTEVTDNDLWFFENIDTSNFITGSHTTDKYVSFPDGVETHEITRTTHLEYDADGETVVLDFTSLSGTHAKTE